MHDPVPEQPSPAHRSAAARDALAVAALAVLAAIAYANALHGTFVYDDVQHIRDNPLVRDLANYFASLRGYRALPNRWVAYVTFALNYRVGGLAVSGYHLFNVGVHLANALLVYALVVLAFRAERLRTSALAPSARTVGLVAAALFLAHPLQTQAVTYVVQRITSLAALFYLGSGVAYVAWRLRREEGRAAGGLLVASIASGLLAVRTKEIAATLPLAIVALELTLFGRVGRRWRAVAPFFALPLLIVTTVVHARPGGGLLAGADAATRVQTSVGRLEYLLTQSTVLAAYLRLLLLPVGQNVDHDPAIQRSIAAPEVLCAISLLAALAAFAVFLYRRTSHATGQPSLDPAARLVALGIVWFFVAHAVESSVIPIVDVMNEHRMYLPSVGLFVAAGVGLTALARRLAPAEPARAAMTAGLAIAVALAIATRARNKVWSDEIALWSDAAAKSPNKFRPTLNVGTALIEGGRLREAITPLRRAIELDPSDAWPHVQLGGALLALGRTTEAEPELREALRMRAEDPEALFNLATLLARSGRRSEAKPYLRRFLEVAPPAYEDARRIAAAQLARE